MLDEKNMKITSSRRVSSWIGGCPMRITEVKLYEAENGLSYLGITSLPCTNRKIRSYSAEIEYYDSKKYVLAKVNANNLDVGYCQIETETSSVDYAQVVVTRVEYADGEAWENTSLDRGEELPEQEIIWQTDPLYKVIKTVCRGKTDAKYYPDSLDGGWRCTCGGINVTESHSCASCGVTNSWLDSTFDREYLTSQMESVTEGKKPIPAKAVKKKEAERLVSDKTKISLIFSAIVLIVALLVLTFAYFIPQKQYNNAHKYATLGMYDKAIETFEDLGNFKNSRELVKTFTYEKFVSLTGVADLYITTSEAEPWFSVTEGGVLSFAENKYDGDYSDMKIPHVVDGVVVRELAKNIFLNISEFTEITIPDTVQVIGEQAFMNCTSLVSIRLGRDLTTIMPRAFINCKSLETVTIHDGITFVGQRAFNNCTSLKTAYLGAGVTAIEPYTFANCSTLENIVISSPLSRIGEYALSGCDALQRITCRFSSEEWTHPTVEDENLPFESAKIIFE